MHLQLPHSPSFASTFCEVESEEFGACLWPMATYVVISEIHGNF